MNRKIFDDLTSPDWGRIPDYMRPGIAGYVLRGEPIGDFLTALFEDRLVESYARADSTNLALIPTYVQLLYSDVPHACRGSREKVKAWQEQGGLAYLTACDGCGLKVPRALLEGRDTPHGEGAFCPTCRGEA